MRLFDTHAHLNFPDFEQDYREVWARAKGANLVGLINVGTDLATSRRGTEQAQELGFFASVGIHPHDVSQYAQSDDWKQAVEDMVKDERVVAIGEVGFDFFRRQDEADAQEAVLQYFLDLSYRANKPVIFHCRPSSSTEDAYEDLLAVIGSKTDLRGVIHAFGGSQTVAKQFLDRGLSLSFTAQITYPKNQDFYGKLLPSIPLDRILLETDCPFLPPEGLRGQRNEPRHVDVVARAIALMTERSAEEVAKKTTDNARQLFELQL
jgi:TatD DNase family protein